MHDYIAIPFHALLLSHCSEKAARLLADNRIIDMLSAKEEILTTQ